MSKNYFYSAILFLLFSFSASAQEGKPSSSDALGFYPNPVTNGKIYITSKSAAEKEIIIFDVLGKRYYKAQPVQKRLTSATFLQEFISLKLKKTKTL